MEYKRYDTDIDCVKQKLKNYGIAVIPKVLVKAQYEYIRNEILKSVDTITPHSQVCWDIRQYPKIVEVFARIWETSNDGMVSSFDDIIVDMPPETTGEWGRGDYINFHADQSITKKGFKCVQGMLTLFPIRTGDATIQVIEDSHIIHNTIFYDATKMPNGYEADVDSYIEKGCKIFNVKADAGSLILWDSRTVYTHIPPQRNRLRPNYRMISRICMIPRDRFTPDQLTKKGMRWIKFVRNQT
jgi:hypothetical protein